MKFRVRYSYYTQATTGPNNGQFQQNNVTIFVEAEDPNAAASLIPSSDTSKPGFFVDSVEQEPNFGNTSFNFVT